MEHEPFQPFEERTQPITGDSFTRFRDAALAGPNPEMGLFSWYKGASQPELAAAFTLLTAVEQPRTPEAVDDILSRFGWLATAYNLESMQRLDQPELPTKLPAWNSTPNLRLAWLAFRAIDDPALAPKETRRHWLESLTPATGALISAGDPAWEERSLARTLLEVRHRALSLSPAVRSTPSGTVHDPVLVDGVLDEVTNRIEQTHVDEALQLLELHGCVDRATLIAAYRRLDDETWTLRQSGGHNINRYAQLVRLRRSLFGEKVAEHRVEAIDRELIEPNQIYFHGLTDLEYTEL